MYNPFVVIDMGDRYILYVRTPKTFELLSAVSDREKVMTSLRKFLAGIKREEQLMRKVNNYESVNTKLGIVHTLYDREFVPKNISDEWEDIISDYLTTYYTKKSIPFKSKNRFKFSKRN